MEAEKTRKRVVFLSSSYVNIAKLFAENNKDLDVFLILDRKFPFEIEDIDNFYTFNFDKKKIFEKDKSRYFDNLALMIIEFEPNFIITNNFTKLFSQSFINFMKFRNHKIKLLNIHHADLRIMNEKEKMKFSGLNADIKEFLDKAMLISTIHLIEDEGMDNGRQLAFSYETTLKELKQKGFLHKKEDILNLRIRNAVLSYHERTKVLKLLKKILNDLRE